MVEAGMYRITEYEYRIKLINLCGRVPEHADADAAAFV